MGYVGLTNDDDNSGRDATIEIRDLSKYEPTSDAGVDDDGSNSNCSPHKLSFTTDLNPQFMSWSLVEKGGIGEFVKSSEPMSEGHREYTEDLCLNYDTCY